MGKINLYQSDQLNPVEIQTALNPNADNSIYLLSNERGKLSFYVYSKKDETLILKFMVLLVQYLHLIR
ncbi:hypothetical protein D3790_16105 [Xenorhabdus nematophila]|nr:hypothetical protein D3790_16105 [Xenorhabdus nematophila]